MKDSFLGVASHELKTPLTVIIGYADLILGEMSDKLDPAVMNMVQQIADASERLSNIVRDMVDVSMLDSMRLPLKSQPQDPNALVRESVKETEMFFSMRKQSLQLDLEDRMPQISCDSERIVQAVSNLIGNAVKFTPDGGSIVVETRRISSLRPPQVSGRPEQTVCLIDREPHPYVEIIVRDTGIGIA
jgi:signal transduction histidine kinase